MQILHASTFRQVRRVVFDYLKLCTEFTRLRDGMGGLRFNAHTWRAPTSSAGNTFTLGRRIRVCPPCIILCAAVEANKFLRRLKLLD